MFLNSALMILDLKGIGKLAEINCTRELENSCNFERCLNEVQSYCRMILESLSIEISLYCLIPFEKEPVLRCETMSIVHGNGLVNPALK
jgi:hypothetical protein